MFRKSMAGQVDSYHAALRKQWGKPVKTGRIIQPPVQSQDWLAIQGAPFQGCYLPYSKWRVFSRGVVFT